MTEDINGDSKELQIKEFCSQRETLITMMRFLADRQQIFSDSDKGIREIIFTSNTTYFAAWQRSIADLAALVPNDESGSNSRYWLPSTFENPLCYSITTHRAFSSMKVDLNSKTKLVFDASEKGACKLGKLLHPYGRKKSRRKQQYAVCVSALLTKFNLASGRLRRYSGNETVLKLSIGYDMKRVHGHCTVVLDEKKTCEQIDTDKRNRHQPANAKSAPIWQHHPYALFLD